MHAAKIEISIDTNLNLQIQFAGDEKYLVAVLGGITHASHWVSDRLQKRLMGGGWDEVGSATKIPIVREDDSLEKRDLTAYPTEQELPRDKAIEATQYAIDAMKLRVDAMKKAPETKTFLIDPSLLSQL
tara:strand:- start:116 stop:502 length:387 start_codon:yes stop_codon:yes gene_type:complete